MAFTRALEVKGKPVGEGKEPLVCAPLVGRDEAGVLGELDAIVAKQPDLLEWRVDFFSGIAETDRVVELAREVRKSSAGIPIIFTRRSIREGGETIGISEEQVLEMYQAVARSGAVDFLDYELSCEPKHFAAAVELARETGTKLIASFHNFQKTPSAEEIVAKFVSMEKAGADVAKVAVMPQGLEDVLTVLQATLDGQKKISLPIISMSMGAYGSLSRLFGWVFGSSVSFAVGQKASAPGQVPIEDLRRVLDVLQRSLAGK
ncbi:type I 3-dehydroquinate dehydratase [Aromatoleum evansii]|uniref:3-dehydroquinate dehydratase n=1 Tax=Aromatoleum evansii TaxID=59406 RepID=A0ABZ1ASA6_AROEV|nr:type I 3-dehydroquinate dehydratase [Aromatoleum evansii]